MASHFLGRHSDDENKSDKGFGITKHPQFRQIKETLAGKTKLLVEKFNKVFSKIEDFYMEYVKKFVYNKKLVIIFYLSIVALTLFSFRVISTGFIPDEDQGMLLASITLPDGASLQRTEDVSRKFTEQIKNIEGINADNLTVFGGDGAPHPSPVIVQVKEYEERPVKPGGVVRKRS